MRDDLHIPMMPVAICGCDYQTAAPTCAAGLALRGEVTRLYYLMLGRAEATDETAWQEAVMAYSHHVQAGMAESRNRQERREGRPW